MGQLHIVLVVCAFLFVTFAAAWSPRKAGSIFAKDVPWAVGQTVDTTSGPVTGHAAPNRPDVSEYLGIPYAQPPVGNLRWQPPVEFRGTAAIDAARFV